MFRILSYFFTNTFVLIFPLSHFNLPVILCFESQVCMLS